MRSQTAGQHLAIRLSPSLSRCGHHHRVQGLLGRRGVRAAHPPIPAREPQAPRRRHRLGHQQAAFWTVDVAVRSRCWCLLRDGDSVRDRGWSAVADGWGARRVVLRLAAHRARIPGGGDGDDRRWHPRQRQSTDLCSGRSGTSSPSLATPSSTWPILRSWSASRSPASPPPLLVGLTGPNPSDPNPCAAPSRDQPADRRGGERSVVDDLSTQPAPPGAYKHR